MTQDLTLQSYDSLLNKISSIYERTQQILVEANWHIGREIVENLQANANRAEYGKQLIAKLSEDLTEKYGAGFSATNVENMRRFFLTYRISQTSGKFSWSQYVSLISIKNDSLRKEIETKTIEEHLSARALQEIVKEVKAKEKLGSKSGNSEEASTAQLIVTRGTIGHFCLAKESDEIHTNNQHKTVDLGFTIFRVVPKEVAQKTVQNCSYTYSAKVLRVVDGDTLQVLIHCSLETYTKVKLRLRGIDCPELSTAEGQKAKRYVQRHLRNCQYIVVRTYKTDKYARYLADVFYLSGEENLAVVAEKGFHLNQRLLDARLATLYR